MYPLKIENGDVLIEVELLLTQQPQKLSRLIVEARKHGSEIFVAHVARDRFSDHLTEVGGQGQIAAFVEL